MNKNQKTVLECLKHDYSLLDSPFDNVWDLQDDYLMKGLGDEELDYAVEHLTSQEQFEVLIKFGEWGLKND